MPDHHFRAARLLGITNRLACLVRELLQLQYLKPVLVVFAAMGVHLIKPFYAKTIQKGMTHSKIEAFYQALYTSMDQKVTSTFFNFEEPKLSGVSVEMFEAVKESYSLEIIKAIKEMAECYMDEVILIANFVLPELRTVLARQRRDYDLDEQYPAEYPVQSQAANVDDTPVHNIGSEQLCGLAHQRLKKLMTLNSVSRSIILQRTKQLRENSDSSFRSYREQAKAKHLLELKWSEKMKKNMKEGVDEKQVLAFRKETKRLQLLEGLKKSGGPFTSATEVKTVVKATNSDKDKQQRLKKELKFARDSSTTLPCINPLFDIQVTLPTKKRRDKNATDLLNHYRPIFEKLKHVQQPVLIHLKT